MRPLSATEAITPAIERTKALLRPFSLKLWLKLGFVAFLAEMSGQFLFPPTGNISRSHSFTPGIGAVAGGISLLVAAVIGILFFLIGLALLYFGSRMQLVLMDLVATHTTLVGPAWQRTRPRTWPWIGFKVVSFLLFFVALAAIAVVPIIYFVRSTHFGAQPPAAASLGAFALFFVALFALILAFMIVTWSLRDFVLPFALFEGASFRTALANATLLFRREPGSVLFYFFMKFVLSLVAGIAAELCIVLSLIVLAIPFGLVGGGLWFGLHQAGTAGTAIMYLGFVVLGTASLIVLLGLILCIAGPTLLFYQAYALYFVGGRIQHLGELLDRSAPPPAFAYAENFPTFPPQPGPPPAPLG